MENKVYEVRFNDYGIIHIVAENYRSAVKQYDDWIAREFPEKEWTTKSITELPATKPTLLTPHQEEGNG